MAPAHVGLGVFQLLLGFLLLAQLKVIQTAAQALPGHVTVAVLATAVLALHHDTGGDVGQTHRRVGLVDVLTTGAGCAEGVGAHVARVDFDLDRVINFGVHKHRCKRGVAAARTVERRLAHQAVHTSFGAQVAKSVFTFDLDGGALDAGGIAVGDVFHRGGEAFAFRVFQVLAQQHAGPVAGLGTTGTGLDVQEAGQGIGRVVKHAAEFQAFDGFCQLGGFGLDRE